MNRTETIYVPGTPAPQPRPRMTRTGRAYNPPTADAWKAAVRSGWTISANEPFMPFAHGLRVRMEFILARPAGHWKKSGGLVKSAPAEPLGKPDVDNLGKAVFDALENAGAFPNDSNILSAHLSKRYAAHDEVEGCRITLTERDS